MTSDLDRLVALPRDRDLSLPEPVRTYQGELPVELRIPGVPQPRTCSLLGWLKGRMLNARPSPQSPGSRGATDGGAARACRVLAAPAGFKRPRYDWSGPFGDNDLTKVSPSEVWSRIPGSCYEPFETVTSQARQTMEEFGQGGNAFGVIHADIGIGANVLFGGREARAVDFDDCAFGYCEYDIGVALSGLRGDDAFPRYRDALLDGYAVIRSLSEEQWVHLDLFIAT